MEVTGQPAPVVRLRIEVEVWRGSIPETRHRIQVAVVDASGALVTATAEPDLVTSFRSSAKPFQLLPLVEGGHTERWGFSQEDLAIMAASHTGSPYHLALVKEILARLGVGESALACGYHDPVDAESLDHVQTHPEWRSVLYNNCSGKHAGMLAQALAEGWPLEGYEKPEHPLQRRVRDTVADLCGVKPESLLLGVDGCSVCVFGTPLRSMAYAYAKFAAARPGGDARERALDRIRNAMMEFPIATGGGRRFSSQLMMASDGALVAKGGAEGLECVGVPAHGLGIALKCEDGRSRGVGPAVVALLRHLDLLSEEQAGRLEAWRRPLVRNAAGLVVGEIRARVVDALDAVTT
jgi:L-asparaginase II